MITGSLRVFSLSSLLCLAGSLLAGAVLAQEENDSLSALSDLVSRQTDSTERASTVEQVIVTGQRTISSLINEGQRETDSFYARLNEVLDNEDFRIRCQIEYPPGSAIARRVCRMRFQEELLSRAALADIQNIGSNEYGELIYEGAGFDVTAEWLEMQRQFEEDLLLAVNTDLELNQSVLRLKQLKAAVESYETPASQRRRERREAEDRTDAPED